VARLALILAIGGGVLVFIGGQEWLVSRGAGSEAAAVALADLENGTNPPHNFLRVGEHVAIYPACVYSYKTSKYAAQKDATPDSALNYCYYPILSPSHAFFKELEQAAAKHGGIDQIPDDQFPEINDIRVLVKTQQFKQLRNIPTSIAHRDAIEGVVINQISSLGSEETKLLKQSFSRLDTAKVLILEEGRKPASLLKSLGMVLGGLALIGVGLVLFLANRNR
jgi:hypothetical protein